MTDQNTIFKEYLEKKGLKLTTPRRNILDAVFAFHEHFNAEELYDRLKAAHKGISLATVYRTIPLLVDSGLVQQAVRSSGRERYEHIYGHPRHIHWLCRSCGTLMESDLQELSSAVVKLAGGLRFTAEQVSISVTGLCWKCSTNENENHIDEK